MALAGAAGLGRVNYGDAPKPLGSPLPLIRRMAGYLRPYWRGWLLILLCIGLGAALGLVPPLLIRELIDRALPNRDIDLLLLSVAGIVVTGLLARLVGVGQSSVNVRIGHGVMFDLRNEMYRHLQRQSLRFFTDQKTGEVMSRVNNDVNGIEGVITGTLVSLVTNTVTVVSITILMFALNWQLALVSLGILPFFILPTRRVGRTRQVLRRRAAEQQGALSALMQETLSISGLLLVKSFARERYEAERFRQRSSELRDTDIRMRMVGRWFFMVIGLFQTIGPAAIYLYGGWLVIQDVITIGTVVAFVSFLRQLYGPVSELASVHVDVMTSVALFERIFHYLDLAPEIQEPSAPVTPREMGGTIEFDHVTFGYTPERMVLEDVSFTAEAGQLVALVGPSGAGKTTVTYLVPRFYDPGAGTISVDGVDVKQLSSEWLRSQIGVVTQETFLFHASVAENLRYGRQDAADQEMVAACRAANIHEFITSLPDGYDTVVGERGYRLSGGEKQRLAIARVLLKNPRILLLDEATSSLDSRSEALIQEALAPLMRGRTSLVIAHRLSTILAADLILVFEGGRLVERGRHAELVTRDGLYARLYHQQFKSANGDASPAAVGQGISGSAR
ncbi:MAG: ABC transporter ATP-binding protein [Chloroflexota bacterium]